MQNTPEYDVHSTLIQDLLKEKRRERWWRNIRFIAWFALIAFIFFQIFSFANKKIGTGKNDNYVALVRLNGMIAPGRDFSAETTVPLLREAFADKNAKGVILDINSPGGTPVQAAIIHDAILAYKKKYHKRVIVVGEDLLTSGAYFVSVAADKIYVNPNTLTGSIGVIMKGFGFVDLMKKVGVERRVYAAGANKDRLDPFLPQNPEDLQKVQSVINEVHHNFEQAVLDGRKGKIKGNPSDLFTGDFWSGQTAMNLGLVDGLGNLMDVSDKEFHTTEYKVFGDSSNFLRMIGGQLGSAFDSMVYVYS